MFCQKCGNKLKQEKRSLFICPACGYHHYINPRLTNGIFFFNDNDEILLVKRKYDPQKGKWDIVGGFVDIQESLEESLQREVKEELGIVIDLGTLKYIGSEWDRYDYKGESYYTVPTFFIAKLPNDQTLQLSSDVSEARWFKRSEIPDEELAFESLKRMIKKLSAKDFT